MTHSTTFKLGVVQPRHHFFINFNAKLTRFSRSRFIPTAAAAAAAAAVLGQQSGHVLVQSRGQRRGQRRHVDVLLRPPAAAAVVAHQRLDCPQDLVPVAERT